MMSWLYILIICLSPSSHTHYALVGIWLSFYVYANLASCMESVYVGILESTFRASLSTECK